MNIQRDIILQTFDTALRDVILTLRDEFEGRDESRLFFEVAVSGRAHDTDGIKIEYRLGGDYSGAIEGNDIEACMVEYFRRKGWETRYDTPLLVAPEATLSEASVEVGNQSNG